MEQLENKIAELVAKLPQIPERTRLFWVKLAPWALLIVTLLLLPVVLAVLGLGTVLLPFSFLGGAGQGFAGIFSLFMSLAVIVLNIIAIPGLFKRSRRGWLFSFYAVLAGGVHKLFMFHLVGLILSTGIGLYFLFQIRSYYNGGGKAVV